MRAENSFSKVAGELIARREKEGVSPRTLEKYRWVLKLFSAEISRRPVAEISPAELLHELKYQECRGKFETAKRMHSFASRVFRYAAATARAERDPAQMFVGALIQPRVKHFAAITEPTEFGALLRAIEDCSGDPAVMNALKLTPHVFQRPGEHRDAIELVGEAELGGDVQSPISHCRRKSPRPKARAGRPRGKVAGAQKGTQFCFLRNFI